MQVSCFQFPVTHCTVCPAVDAVYQVQEQLVEIIIISMAYLVSRRPTLQVPKNGLQKLFGI